MATEAYRLEGVKLVKSFGQDEGSSMTGVVTKNKKCLFKKVKHFLASLLTREVQRMKPCDDVLSQTLRKFVKWQMECIHLRSTGCGDTGTAALTVTPSTTA